LILKNAAVNVNHGPPNQKVMTESDFNDSRIEVFAIKKYFKEKVVKYHHENLSKMPSRSS